MSVRASALIRQAMIQEAEYNEAALRSMIDVAELHRDQRHYDKAEPLLLKTEQTARRVLGDGRAISDAGMNNLAELYETWASRERPKSAGKNYRNTGPQKSDTMSHSLYPQRPHFRELTLTTILQPENPLSANSPRMLMS